MEHDLVERVNNIPHSRSICLPVHKAFDECNKFDTCVLNFFARMLSQEIFDPIVQHLKRSLTVHGRLRLVSVQLLNQQFKFMCGYVNDSLFAPLLLFPKVQQVQLEHFTRTQHCRVCSKEHYRKVSTG